MKILAIATFIMHAISSYAQNSTLKIVAIVQDNNTHLPIPFASISILHSAIGTVTNESGLFKLTIPIGEDSSSLIIRSIGYKVHEVSIKSFSNDKKSFILLFPQTVRLDEAVIAGYTAQSLLKKAVRNTSNHMMSPALCKSYYREFVRLNGEYTKFADALVDYRLINNKNLYYRLDVQTKVSQSRAKELRVSKRSTEDFPSPIDVEQAINGYERDPDAHSNFLDSVNFKFYNYTLAETVNNKGDGLYLVSFSPITHNPTYLFSGTILISKRNFCIESVNSQIADDLQPFAKASNIIVAKLKLNNIKKRVEYRELLGRYYLNFIRIEFDVTCQVGNKPPLRYKFSNEMVVNDVTSEASPILKKEQYKGRSLYKSGTNYQFPFWENANVIVATPEEQAIINALVDAK